MREIKFKRVFFFDEEKTKFSHCSDWGVGIKHSTFTMPSNNNFAPYFKDIQYTGLKYKNNDLIYEGDIIRGETRNFEVIFYAGMFTTDVGQYLLNGEYEKIGTIYENPELLSGSEV
jgi:hypothetical protein